MTVDAIIGRAPAARTDELLGARPTWGSFIAGSFVQGEADVFDVLECSTGRHLARVANASVATVDRAVADARRAYEDVWRDMSPRERGSLMRQVAVVIREHAEELAELCAREVGKPKRDALRVDVVSSHTNFDYYAGIADTVHGEIIHQGPVEARVAYEPYGVVAAILPFNWPVQHLAKKCAPALAVGNTVVVKPGEQAPLAILRLIELANQVLPPGVMNAVNGIAAGPALIANSRIERVTFTGSTATGRKVMAAAAQHVTYVTLELGGKNALIVLDDADLDAAVTVAIEGMFYNNGMACTSTSRILVHDSLYDAFAERFVAAAGDLVVGEPLDPRTDIGPLVDRRQQDRVETYVNLTRDEGAPLLFEGVLPEHPQWSEGFWVKPRIFGEITRANTIAREEVFGPVAALMRFSSDDEAVEIANDTDYGLTAAICTRDETRAARLATRLEVGMVFVNQYTRRTFVGSPFGGVKGSGFGREYSAETLHEFVRAKNVRFPSGHGEVPTWPPPGVSIVRELTVGTFTPSLVIELARADGRFADAGLEVTEVAVTSSPQQFRALASGEYDVIFTNPDNVIAYQFLRDNPLGENLSLRVIAGIDRGLGLGLFRGAHVGESLPPGLLGVDVATSGFAFVAYDLLARRGISMSDMIVENLGATPRRAEALIRGACDYTILNAGNDLRALAQGCSLVAPVVEIGPYLATALVALHTDDVEVRAVHDRFRDALGATITSILSGYRDDDVVATLQSLLGLTPKGAHQHLRCMKDPATGLVADLGVDTASLTTIVSLRTRHRPSEELATVLESLGDFVDADVLG